MPCYLVTFTVCHYFPQAVWFGCDVGKHFERKLGALHLDVWVSLILVYENVGILWGSYWIYWLEAVTSSKKNNWVTVCLVLYGHIKEDFMSIITDVNRGWFLCNALATGQVWTSVETQSLIINKPLKKSAFFRLNSFHYFFCSHNYELAFGISMVTLDKAQRLLYGDSLMTHAMVFTGLSWEVGWKEKY